MNVLGQVLDGREERRRLETEGEALWLRERAGVDAAERLESWDRWVRRTLAESLVWPDDEARRTRLVAQCAEELTVMVRQLRGRGWLLDGKALANHVTALLAPVAKAQRAGKVGDFWPYFRAAVSRYVGANAEEIQQLARRSGADEGAPVSIGQLVSGLAIVRPPAEPSMTELVTARAAEVAVAKAGALREKQKRARAKEAARKADAAQPRLL